MAWPRRFVGLGHVDAIRRKQKGTRVHYTGPLSNLPFWSPRSKHEFIYARCVLHLACNQHSAQRQAERGCYV